MELRKYLAVLLHGWWVILIFAGAGYAGLTQFVNYQTKIYSAITTLVISPDPAWANNEREILDSMINLDEKRSIIVTDATMIGSNTVKQAAIDTLHLPPEQQLNLNVIVQDITDANAIQITVEAVDPQVAADVANTIARQSVSNLQHVYQIYDLSQVSPATPQPIPVRPNPDLPILGAPIGIALGSLLVLFLYYLRGAMLSPFVRLRRRQRSANAKLASYVALSKLVRQTLQRLPARQRELGLIMIELPPSSAGAPTGQSPALQVRAALQPSLRHEDTIAALPETNMLAVILPSSNQADAERCAAHTQARLALEGLGLRWSAAAYAPADGRSDAVIWRAEAHLLGPRTESAPPAGVGSPQPAVAQ
jgi:capsular polysaccharide biosynthesis protein